MSTPTGRLAVRNGSKVVVTLHDSTSGNNVDRVFGVWPFSQTGAVALSQYAAGPRVMLHLLTQDLAFSTGVEATSRTAITAAQWPTTVVHRPVVVELFEKLFVCDAQLTQADRGALFSMTAALVQAVPSFDFSGDASAGVLFPYTIEAYNGVLFAAGNDLEGTLNAPVAASDEPAILRHSFLGRSPDSTGAGVEGFDTDAWALIGAKGQRITALKSGSNILLAAKENELYRITGTGRALPGWQYTIQKVENSTGFGCSNAHALCFAEGSWWGVGEAGPWRSDGQSIISLCGERRDSWREVTNLRQAWVAYHPERRFVLFGFHMTPVDDGRSVTYPYTIWQYDVEREQWTGDAKYSADIMLAQAIPSLTDTGVGSSSYAGPSARPSNIDAVGSGGSYTLSWNNGDSAATTEIWLRLSGLPSTLNTTAAAGATSKAVTGFTPTCYVKMRHMKNGIPSDFTAEFEIAA